MGRHVHVSLLGPVGLEVDDEVVAVAPKAALLLARLAIAAPGPDKRIKTTLTYPMTTGRNFLEILRLLDSCQLTANEQVATPANWQQGESVIIVPSVSNDAAADKYPAGWDAPLPYLRFVAQPTTV